MAAVRFAGAFEEVQAPLLGVMRDLAGSLGHNAAMCSAMLAGALVPCLSISQVVPPLSLLAVSQSPALRTAKMHEHGTVCASQSGVSNCRAPCGRAQP